MKKEETKKNYLLIEDLKKESEKPVASRDGFNPKELSIGKQGDELNIETPNTGETKDTLGVGNKGEYSGFDWENIRINKEPIDDILDPPKLFDEETEEANAQQKRNDLSQEIDLTNVAAIKPITNSKS